MLRRGSLLAALLLVSAALPAQARGKRAAPAPPNERLQKLINEFASMAEGDYGSIADPEDRLKRLEEILTFGENGLRFVVQKARDPHHADIKGEILRLLAADHMDSHSVVALFRQNMEPENPHRRVVRDALLERARAKGSAEYPREVFEKGTSEDRFAALLALGRLADPGTVVRAMRLLRDRTWKAEEDGIIRLGTLAIALESLEGREAARLLLLLRRDPRFSTADAAALRAATRLWEKPDLTSHIRMADLADGDAGERAEMARFLGEAGIETARAPLLQLVSRRAEPVEVRVAAARALGQLRVARADLVPALTRLLGDEERRVRHAAVDALAQLRVRPAVEVLMKGLNGELGDEIRRALSRAYEQETGRDWRRWFDEHGRALPEGA